MSGNATGDGLRVRRDVQSLLAEGDSGRRVLDQYAAGIEAMRARDPDDGGDPTDPLSWRFQAAIHGFPGVTPSIDHPNRWGSCRHNSWFFLPWHRMYLLFFERIVRSHVGDDSWALPYWDYTKTGDESSRVLPEPFRSPTAGNPLFTDQRDPDVNSETDPMPLRSSWAGAIGALEEETFALAPASAITSFGGGAIRDAIPGPSARGSLERKPHGLVHGNVGGESGWMWTFETAGLDPIFWLHHCNLDRLWDVWISMYGADMLPAHPAWTETEFEFFDVDGSRTAMAVGDVLSSADLGYAYESIEPPEGTLVPERRDVVPASVEEEEPHADLAGAAPDVDLSSRASVGVDISAAPAPAVEPAEAGGRPLRWFLRVEDVTGTRPATPAYDVYLNVPDDAAVDEHEERMVGSIATFGIPEATAPEAEHGGIGITDVFEITDVVNRLQEREEWDPTTVTVTIVPADPRGAVEGGGDVRAGRVSVYTR
ncbi:MAG TPA: tyrosinase family protein [Solirubrobacteraceae bacterium]|jgi:tyrosinase|nr:tyrosinase family protein [Solirubrobacteraceae bacterium]